MSDLRYCRRKPDDGSDRGGGGAGCPRLACRGAPPRLTLPSALLPPSRRLPPAVGLTSATGATVVFAETTNGQPGERPGSSPQKSGGSAPPPPRSDFSLTDAKIPTSPARSDPRMNPTVTVPQSAVRTEADGSVVVTLATDPARPPVPFDATIRHPEQFRAALGAFLSAVVADIPQPPARSRPTPWTDADSSLRAEYAQARRACAWSLIDQDPDLWRTRLPVDPIVTVADDAWIVEGFSADQSAYARISVSIDEFLINKNVQVGTTSFCGSPTFIRSLDQIRGNLGARLRMVESIAPSSHRGPSRLPGWLRGFAGIQSAMSLPTRRVAIDRGGLFGLISALGRSTRVRAGRSIEVIGESGRPPRAVVRPGARPIPLHARAVDDHLRGSVRVAVGDRLSSALAGLLPWMESADLFWLGPGLPSFWSVRLGGIRVLLGFPSWTPDGRLGSLCLDPLVHPVEPGRFLANQVAATFRDHPAQTRRQVVDRTRGAEPEVAAILSRLAGLGRVLPEPDTGLFRWRSAFGDPVPSTIADDPEPAEVTAARAITRTTSVQITRDEVRPDGKARRIEGQILDRPVTLVLDADGWISRGRCTCSHQSGGAIDRRGPCRHLISLQAQAQAGSAKSPPDLATWFAAFPAPVGSD